MSLNIRIFSKENKLVYVTDNIKDDYIEYEINSPDKFFFEISKDIVKYFENEGYVETNRQRYVIKEIEEIGFSYNIVVVQDLEEFDTYYDNKTYATVTLENMVKDLLPPGWKLDYKGNQDKKTVTANNMCAYDILAKIIKEFGAEIEFDNKLKIVRAGYELGEDKGVYFTDELNLESKYLTSESYDFATRIIPIGKDGMTIAAINNGKVYLEDFTYSTKVKTVYWEDNRYTIITNLREAAQEKLDRLSKPLVTYDTTVADLSEATGYEILDFAKGDLVTLIDRDTKVKDKYRIVKFKEYIDDPFRNEVVLGNKIKDLVSDEKELEEQINDYWSQTKTFFEVTEESIKSSVTTAENYTDNAFKTYKTEREQTDRKIYEEISESTTYIDTETGQTETVKDKVLSIDKSVDGLEINIIGKADKDKLVTQLNATSEYVKIKSNLITLDGNTDVKGDFNVSGNMIVGGTIQASSIKTRDFDSERWGETKLNGNSLNVGTNSSYITITDRDGRGQVDVNGTVSARGSGYVNELQSAGLYLSGAKIYGGSGFIQLRPYNGGSIALECDSSGVSIYGKRLVFNSNGTVTWS